jgi:beta-glucanase (GH16 family)
MRRAFAKCVRISPWLALAVAAAVHTPGKARAQEPAGPAAVTASAGAEGWKLVWSDEFDKPGQPDPAKWAYEEGYIRNNERQFYTRARAENARVEDGVLVIEARKEQFKIPAPASRGKGKGRSAKGRDVADYTSASLTTRGKASWTYGRIEVRAKLPTGRGMWPAIWTLGDNINQVGWPACGEIDIMENVGFDPDTICANIHTKSYNHVMGTNKGSRIKIPKPYQDFHVYAIEWRPERLDFFVDKTKYFTFQNEGKGTDAWPYDKPQYLILNIAVGGAWGGQKGIDDGIFPQRMCVDYVRVYQRPGPSQAAPVAR